MRDQIERLEEDLKRGKCTVGPYTWRYAAQWHLSLEQYLNADTARCGYCSIGLVVKGKHSITIDL